VKSDIQQIFDLFHVIKNVKLHGVIGQDIPLDWVSVEKIYWAMPKPKMTKDKIRYFCEYQVQQGNLDKRTGKDKETRQAQAEYSLSEKGKRTIAAYDSTEFSEIKKMILWTHKNLKQDKRSETEKINEDE